MQWTIAGVAADQPGGASGAAIALSALAALAPSGGAIVCASLRSVEHVAANLSHLPTHPELSHLEPSHLTPRRFPDPIHLTVPSQLSPAVEKLLQPSYLLWATSGDLTVNFCSIEV